MTFTGNHEVCKSFHHGLWVETCHKRTNKERTRVGVVEGKGRRDGILASHVASKAGGAVSRHAGVVNIGRAGAEHLAEGEESSILTSSSTTLESDEKREEGP